MKLALAVSAPASRSAASAPPRPAGGHCLAWDKKVRSPRTTPTTARRDPSHRETPSVASSWRSARTLLSPASAASFSPPRQLHPRYELYRDPWQTAFADLP